MKCDEKKNVTKEKSKDNTPYDDVGKTMLHECPALIIPIINEIFGEEYLTTDKVERLSEIHIYQSGDEETDKGYKDGFIRIIGKKTGYYHIELQSIIDSTMVFRMFEYDIGEAMNRKEMEGNRLVITIVRSAVIYLRHNRSTPETYVIEIRTPGGNVAYEVPILKTQKYTLDEIFEKKLLFLLPFYLFCYEKDFAEISEDEEKLCKMKEEYRRIKEKLDTLHEKKEITLYEKQTIISMIKRVAENLALKHKKIREGVNEFMGGKVLMYEAREILLRGIQQGIEQEKKNTAMEKKRADEAEKLAEDALLEVERMKKFLSDNGLAAAF